MTRYMGKPSSIDLLKFGECLESKSFVMLDGSNSYNELLTGHVPFTGKTPTEIAIKHLRKPMPAAKSAELQAIVASLRK